MFCENMDDILFVWIGDLQGCNFCLSRTMMIHEAKTLTTAESFEDSIG